MALSHVVVGQPVAATVTNSIIDGVNARGTVLLATKAFSAVSTASMDAFTNSAYDYYEFKGDFTRSTSLNVAMKVRVAGADDSTASSYTSLQEVVTTGAIAVSSLSTSTVTLSFTGTGSTPFSVKGTLWNLGLGEATRYEFDSVLASSRVRLSGGHSVTSAFDSFSLIANTGTITGEMSVFGVMK